MVGYFLLARPPKRLWLDLGYLRYKFFSAR